MNERARILIVAADESTRRTLKSALGQHGYETETAATGREALEKARSGLFSVALLGTGLPELGGVDLMAALRETRPEMMAIMVTAYASRESAVSALSQGASAYILEPVDADEVLATVRGALEKQRLVLENRRLSEEVRRKLAECSGTQDALRESEARFRDLYENAPIAYFSVGIDGRIQFANRAAGELLAHAPEELIGRPVSELYADTPDGKEKAATVFRRFQAGEETWGEHLQVLRGDGTTIWISLSVQPVLDEAGQVVASRSTVLDITERRRAKDALRESEERHRRLLELLPDGVAVHSDGRLVFANDAAARLVGAQSSQEIIGKPIFDFIHPDYRSIDTERMRQTLQEGSTIPLVEDKFVRLDGTAFDVEVTATPTSYLDSPAIQVVFRDITERKRMGEALRESEERYRAVAESTADAIAINVGTTRVYVNRAFLEIHGIADASQAVGLPMGQFILPEDRERVLERTLARQRGKDFPGVYEYRIRRPDGEVRRLQITGAAIEYQGQSASLSVLRDVTELSRLREQLVQTDKLAAVGTLVSGVAHEINNPLAGALGHVELLLRRNLDEEAKGELEVVRDETMRVVRIIRNLLSFSRQNSLEKAPISPNHPLEAALDLLLHELRLANVRVEKDLQPDLPLTMADPAGLQQVFFNLLLNAKQAIAEAKDHGVITLRTRRSGDVIEVTVTDDGPGIGRGNLSKIFDPFFTTKPVGEGTGLGLSISYGIVLDHGGVMRVSSEPGEGATFTVEIPIVADNSARVSR